MNVASMTQRQWYSRPADEKFDSLESLYGFLKLRRERSNQVDVRLGDLKYMPVDTGGEMGSVDLVTKDGLHLMPSHWSFEQLASTVKAHPTLMRELPANIVCDAMNWLTQKQVMERNLPLGLLTIDPINTDERGLLQGIASQKYGRIWDEQLAQVALEIRHLSDGAFDSPKDWGGEKKALFAGDRDCHILLVNGGSIVDGGMTAKGESDLLYRGFIMGNSEVRAKAWYWATFLFRFVCGNFAIHGIEQVEFAKVIHTPSAPATFAREALPALTKYVQGSPRPLEEVIRKAKDMLLPKGIRERLEYFQHRGFTQFETQRAQLHAMKEEGGVDTLWQMFNGFTASARSIKYRDVRTNLERRAGKLLEMVAA